MNRDETRLVLREFPVIEWIIGLSFSSFSSLGIFSVYHSYLEGQQVSAGGAGVLFIFLAVGLLFLLYKSVLTITADRIMRTLKLEYRSLLHYRLKQFSFDEIAGIAVQCGYSRSSFGVSLKQKDGKVIRFQKTYSNRWKPKERQAQMLREFIDVPGFDTIAGSNSYGELQPYVDSIQETDGIHWQLKPIGNYSPRWHSPDFRSQGVFVFLAQIAESQSSFGSLGIKFALSTQGFQAEDTPGLDQATVMARLDPAIASRFVALSNAPDFAGQILNPRAVKALAGWAGRHPLKMFNKASSVGQLVMLVCPNGVYLGTLNMSTRDQVNELATLGVELVKSQE
jgi:hypothetical protein